MSKSALFAALFCVSTFLGSKALAQPWDLPAHCHIVECQEDMEIRRVCGHGSSPEAAKSDAFSKCGGSVVDDYVANCNDFECLMQWKRQTADPRWRVFVCVRCRNGQVEKVRGVGSSYCEAYCNARRNACNFARWHCGACRIWIVKCQRPDCVCCP